METDLKQNGFWAGQLEYLTSNNLGFDEIAKQIGVLDPEKTAAATKN